MGQNLPPQAVHCQRERKCIGVIGLWKMVFEVVTELHMHKRAELIHLFRSRKTQAFHSCWIVARIGPALRRTRKSTRLLLFSFAEIGHD